LTFRALAQAAGTQAMSAGPGAEDLGDCGGERPVDPRPARLPRRRV